MRARWRCSASCRTRPSRNCSSARSDHFSVHQIGIPALFFFEGLPIDKNPDYHTWRDTLDKLDLDKMLRTTRLVFATTWLLANDDERPPRPPS